MLVALLVAAVANADENAKPTQLTSDESQQLQVCAIDALSHSQLQIADIRAAILSLASAMVEQRPSEVLADEATAADVYAVPVPETKRTMQYYGGRGRRASSPMMVYMGGRGKRQLQFIGGRGKKAQMQYIGGRGKRGSGLQYIGARG